MTPELPPPNPFPGPRPFETEEQHLFFGRDREVRELFSLLVAHRVVLLYAPSGAGKTSLLNAAFIPLLKREGFDVLPVARVGGTLPPGIAVQDIANIHVFNALRKWEGLGGDFHSLAALSVSEYLAKRSRPTDEEGEPVPRVIILDQFEELFSVFPEDWKRQREEFFRALAKALEADSRLRVLFAMREDYLGNFEPYAELLPDRARVRFRLTGLRAEAACKAVEGPVRAVGREFASGVTQRLCHELLKIRVQGPTGETIEVDGEYVEPVQLQVVCEHLWREVPEGTKVINIEPTQLGTVDEALRAFYEQALADAVKQTKVKEIELRDWFGEKLITPGGTRGTVFQGRDDTEGIPNPAVGVLDNKHIIRGDVRAGGRWYELTHDRLIEPVRRSNQEWQRIRGVRIEQHAVRLQWFVIALLVMLATVLVLGAYVYSLRQEARRERDRAFSHALAAAAIKNLNEDPERSVLFALHSISTAHAAGIQDIPWAEDALRRAIQQGLRVELTLTAHTMGVSGVAYSPDGTRLVTASWDETVKLWDVASGKELPSQIRHEEPITAVAFSPNGDFILTASNDKTARVWEADSGSLRFPLDHKDSVVAIAASTDGTRILTGSADNTARVWDARTGGLLRLLRHPDQVWGVALSHDGKLVATAGRDNKARIWDVNSDREPKILPHDNAVASVAFSPDGQSIVTGSWNNDATLWDVRSGRKKDRLAGHSGPVTTVAFSPDGRRVATASLDRTVKVWDADSGEESLTLRGHTDAVLGIAFNPRGTHLATASRDGTARVWDIGPSEELRVAGSRVLVFHFGGVYDVAYSPNGKLLATAGWKGAKLWDAKSGQELPPLPGQSDAVFRLTFSPDPDGKRLATASADKTAKVWDTESGELLHVFKGHADKVSSVAFSPDGKRLLTASEDKTAKIWDALSEDEDELATLSGHTDRVFAVAFSPDGTLIATGSRDTTAKVWDAASGQERFTLYGHNDTVFQVAFSPDGKHLATASGDGTAKVWAVESGKELLALSGHSAFVADVAFSPDGSRIATGSWDSTVRIWNAATGEELYTLSGHSADKVWGVAFSPDGKQLATASEAWTVESYVLKTEDLMRTAWMQITRTLTTQECQKYLRLEKRLEECPVTIADLIVDAKARARAGDLGGAIARFREAVEMERILSIDPELEARRLAAAAVLAEGEHLARQGMITETLQRYQKAQDIDPELKISVNSWNSLCWHGSLAGDAEKVLFACQKAVELLPENGTVRDSRGLALALTGDIQGAIEDFEAYTTWAAAREWQGSPHTVLRRKRERWVRELRAGRNPFTPKVLEELRHE